MCNKQTKVKVWLKLKYNIVLLTKGEMKQNIKMSLPKNRHQNACQTGKFHKICLTNMSGLKKKYKDGL